MPKIEVNEKLFFEAVGRRYDYAALEDVLPCAKAELDERPDETLPENERTIKIELNDTNRPDLWSTNGVARQLKLHAYDVCEANSVAKRNGKMPDYFKFMANRGNTDYGERVINVEPEMKDIRPFMVAFLICGKPIDDTMLKDIIQTQEKLCWNFGRKRKSISMGVYRAEKIKFPATYKAVDPDKTSFVPLQCEQPMTCRQILTDHPKGRDFGWILEGLPKFPLLTDSNGEVLSMAPIINGAFLGAAKVGDTDLMVEMTGDNMENLLLSMNIVACDFIDQGYDIKPILVKHPYETGFGRDIMTPFYFQKTTKAKLSNINKVLGSEFDIQKICDALTRMGSTVETKQIENDWEITLAPPPYRNDFLHEVDVTEDVMIGLGVSEFPPLKPRDFTIGKLSDVTLFSRKAKEIMVGLGYQEMIFNYLGSKKDYVERMNIDARNIIEIENPMSENYQFVRNSIIPSLLRAESGSANAIFPHKIFEVGKVAYICDAENTGTLTRQNLGLLTVASNANFNTLASEISSLLYFLNHEYKVVETEDPRFVPGRQAGILVGEKQIGIFGEVHPQVLENWAIQVPCVAAELDLEELM